MKKLIILVLLLTLKTSYLHAQADFCNGATVLNFGTDCLYGNNNNATDDNRGSDCAPFSTGTHGVWYQFTATSTSTDLIVAQVTKNSIFDINITIYTGSCNNLIEFICNDSGASGEAEAISFATTVGVTYYALVDAVFAGSFCVKLVNTPKIISPNPPSNNCANAQPFCTDSTYVYPAGVNQPSAEAGPNYTCLNTQPNPVWYYLKIKNTGPLDIFMYNTNEVDIDYTLWGPFSSLEFACNDLYQGNTVDCSYSTAATETVNIPNAQTGEYYKMLITNYSDAPTNIIFEKVGGTGTTDCEIVYPSCNITIVATTTPCDSNGNTRSIGLATISNRPVTGSFYLQLDNQLVQLFSDASVSEINFNYVIAGESGSHTIKAWLQNDSNCTALFTFEAPTCCSDTIVKDTSFTICSGENIVLQASTSLIGNYSYQWTGPNNYTSNQATNILPNATIPQAGVYTLTIKDILGDCVFYTEKINYIIKQTPSAIISTTSPVCEGEKWSIIADTAGNNNAQYTWQTPTGSKDSIGIVIPIIQNTNAGTYTLTITLDGCSATNSFELVVLSLSGIELSNIITPNEDGKNDNWELSKFSNEKMSLVIYNRWGNLIAETSTLPYAWNGKDKNGNKVTDGVYFYILTYKDCKAKDIEKKGFITLIK